MSRLVAAELFKLRTTRTFFGICLGVLALIALICSLSAALDDFDAGDQPVEDLVGIATFVWPFALVVGVLGTATEFRHGTITVTLLAVPNRPRLLAAKLLAHLLAGAVLGLVAFLFAAGLSAAIIGSRDIDSGLSGDELLEITAGGALAASMYAGIGVGLGALVSNQVGGVVGSLAWVFLLEGLISEIPGMDWLKTYGLNGLASSMSEIDDFGIDSDDLIDPVPAGLVLLGITLAFAVAGALVLRRRDVESKT